ncbi:MAG: ATP-dependent metallopeptidase FtsH/Yme1/Tma family protein, partial [Pseudomonas stutzeri]|nr:ATP-dependent metallopeptidase FtsH/Yme1/Tma family protein [Stutzerimonas stutzeri]
MKDRTQFHMNYWMIAVLVFFGLQYLLSIQQEVATIPYSEFEQHLKEGRVEELAITERRIEG